MSLVLPDGVRRIAALVHADLPGLSGTPRPVRFVVAALVAIGLSLGACDLVAAATVAVDPTLSGYEHLRFSDWSELTIIGVAVAALGWPLAGAIWSRARRPFLVLTVLVTVASFAPDLWILRQGQPAAGVLALAVMHVAVAIVTYPALVAIAPQRSSVPTSDAPLDE